jgi:hypothetical protein
MATQALGFQPSAAFLEPLRRSELAEHLHFLETTLFDPLVRHDTNAVADLLTDGFREFGSSGRVYTKPEILAELSTEQSALITLSDFTCELLSPTVALVTYKSLATHDNRASSQALRSSIWVQESPDARFKPASPRENVWRMQFHQGTRF